MNTSAAMPACRCNCSPALARASDPLVKQRIEYIKRDFDFVAAIGDAFDPTRR